MYLNQTYWYMKAHYNNYLIVLSILIFTLAIRIDVLSVDNVKSYASLSLDELYAKLDNMVANRQDFVMRKTERINRAKSRLVNASSRSERYLALTQIFDNYAYFNSDSALVYVDKASAYAPEGSDFVNEWIIKKADIYSAAGLFSEAKREIEKIDRGTVSLELLPNYYNSLQYLYSHNAHFVGYDELLSQQFERKANEYNDSIGKYLTANHPYSVWWNVVKSNDAPISDSEYRKLKNHVDNSNLDQRNDAIAAYWLSVASLNRGDKIAYEKYMIISAIADINIANCDIASLEELANLLYKRNDIDRAYAYINYCSEMAQQYHNRLRIVSISELQDNLHKSYLSAIESQRNRITNYLIAACALILVCIILVVMVVIYRLRDSKRKKELIVINDDLRNKIRELNEARDALSAAHVDLKSKNAELLSVNSQLAETNNIKQQYIMFAFSMASDFINDIDAVFKKLLRKIKTNQYGEVRNELEDPKFISKEMKQFYKTFDKMFISIYPDFVDELNATLPDKEHVSLKDGELPNTKLRIYALHRLGITESAKIAKMLRCSIQTVYNNRPKTQSNKDNTEEQPETAK